MYSSPVREESYMDCLMRWGAIDMVTVAAARLAMVAVDRRRRALVECSLAAVVLEAMRVISGELWTGTGYEAPVRTHM